MLGTPAISSSLLKVPIMHISPICDFLSAKWPLKMAISSLSKLIFIAYLGANGVSMDRFHALPKPQGMLGKTEILSNVPRINLCSFPRIHCMGCISEVPVLKPHPRNSKFIPSLRNPIFFKVPTYITFLSLLCPPLERSKTLLSSLHLK